MSAIGLIGVGRWGRHVARDLVSLGARVTAVCRSEQSATLAREAGVSALIGSVDELADVDGVIVCTPTVTHADVIESIAGLEVPVFVEKPMADDPASARRLVELLGERLFVMDKWRYHGGVLRIVEAARSGRLGAVQGLRTRRLEPSLPHDDVDASWILMPHELSIAIELFGAALEPRIVAAAFHDDAIVHLEALMRGAQGGPWHLAEISSVAPSRARELIVICERGTLSLPDSFADHVLLREFGGIEERLAVSTEMPLLLEIKAFLAHLQGGPPPVSSAAEGLRTVELIDRMRQMAGDGRSLQE